MMSVMSGTGNNGHENQESDSIVQWIGKTNNQVKAFKDVLRNDVKKKRKYEDDVEDVTDTATKKKLKKRIKSLEVAIKDTKVMIRTLKITLKHHQEMLANAISKYKETSEDSSDSVDSSDSSGSDD